MLGRVDGIKQLETASQESMTQAAQFFSADKKLSTVPVKL